MQELRAHRAGTVTSAGRGRTASLRMRMRYCVILVRRCLFLCTRNLGQYARCSSICASAWVYARFSLRAPRRPGQHATANVLGLRSSRPQMHRLQCLELPRAETYALLPATTSAMFLPIPKGKHGSETLHFAGWLEKQPIQQPQAAPDFLPQLAGHMCALNGLQVKVQAAILFFDSGVAAVGQRARGAVAQASDIVLVAAEVLCLRLDLERAVVVVDDLHAQARVALSVSAQLQGRRL